MFGKGHAAARREIGPLAQIGELSATKRQPDMGRGWDEISAGLKIVLSDRTWDKSVCLASHPEGHPRPPGSLQRAFGGSAEGFLRIYCLYETDVKTFCTSCNQALDFAWRRALSSREFPEQLVKLTYATSHALQLPLQSLRQLTPVTASLREGYAARKEKECRRRSSRHSPYN